MPRLTDNLSVKYNKIFLQDGSFDLDCLVKTEVGKVPTIVQKSVLQNKLISYGGKKIRLQRDMNEITTSEESTLEEIEAMDLIFNS